MKLKSYFCIFQAHSRLPLALDVNDALPDSLWRHGWATTRSDDPVIVKVRVQEVKEPAITGDVQYDIDIDGPPSPLYHWRGGRYAVSNLPFIFSVYQLKHNSLIGMEFSAAKSFVAGVLAAGGTAELCYHLRVHKIYEKFHVDVTQ